jgi:hypothetical protein
MGNLVAGQPVWAQFGGRSSYEFLNISTHARLAALGGVNVSHSDKDINFFFSNPALVSDSLAGWASGSYLFYVADIGQTSFAYTHDFKNIGAVSFGVQHINYGEIEAYDATGSPAGQFKSGETALVISKSHRVSYFRLGVNLKTVFSNLAGFRSSAVMLDVGGVFIHPQQELTIGLSFKNLGLVLREYSQSSDTKIPFDVQAGITYKPEHMPLRFSVTVYNLARPGKLYDDPNDENKPATLEKVMSHLNFGAEVLLHRYVHVLAGYNFLRQKEMKVQSGGGGSGFSFGLAAKIKSVDLVIGSSRYATGNANYTITISTDIDQLRFKKTTIL